LYAVLAMRNGVLTPSTSTMFLPLLEAGAADEAILAAAATLGLLRPRATLPLSIESAIVEKRRLTDAAEVPIAMVVVE
jgi:hypothetical protein